MGVIKPRVILSGILLAGIMLLGAQVEHVAASDVPQPDQELFTVLEKLHGHVCAGSLFGARLGLAAKEAIRSAGGQGKLKARYYDLSCPVDGIQVAAGTTYGNAAILVEDRDDHRLVLSTADNSLQVEARVTRKAEALGFRSRDLGKKARALPIGSPERLSLEREIAEIYDWIRTAPTSEVVTIVPALSR